MTPAVMLASVMVPAATLLADLDSDDARVLLLAIAGQESEWRQRLQRPVAHARSYWQFERIAVTDVMERGRGRLQAVCEALDVPASSPTVFEAIAWHDVLACCVARLNLWLNPAPLPPATDVEAAWRYYLATWRPGKPHPGTWAMRHATAVSVVCP